MSEDNDKLAGYMRLAVAIVQSGRAANDKRFLQIYCTCSRPVAKFNNG